MLTSIYKINISCLFKLKMLFSLLIGLFLCGCDSIGHDTIGVLYPDSSRIQIWNQTDLDNVRHCLSCDYILMADIELIEGTCGFDPLSGWLPIGDFNNNYEYFTGTFDGNNHKIAGLWINRVDYVGLFGGLNGANIKNLNIEIDDKGIKGNVSVGTIAGILMMSNITDSYATGDVNGLGNVGGIAGKLDLMSKIINSRFEGNISASEDNIGGIAGFVKFSSITKSSFSGNVSASENIGSIAGFVESGSITDSYSDGNINGGVYVGGIAGDIYLYSSVTNSHFIGNVAGDYNIGGIAGSMSNNSLITKSYSTGNVSGGTNGTGIGGIAGYILESNIAKSYSAGNINGNDSIGGIAGWSDLAGNITNSYSMGNISGNIYVGGIIGWNNAINITSNYFGGEIKGAAHVGGIAGIVIYDSLIKYNAALSSSIMIVGNTYTIGRITGYTYINSNNDVADNLALDTMKIKNIMTNTTMNIRDGIDKTEPELKTKSTYEAMGWKFGNDDDNPWEIDDNEGFPYLYWQ
jgi:hypothetical protein